MRLEFLNENGSGFTVPLQDLKDEALIDWLAVIANYDAGGWGPLKEEILFRMKGSK